MAAPAGVSSAQLPAPTPRRAVGIQAGERGRAREKPESYFCSLLRFVLSGLNKRPPRRQARSGRELNRRRVRARCTRGTRRRAEQHRGGDARRVSETERDGRMAWDRDGDGGLPSLTTSLTGRRGRGQERWRPVAFGERGGVSPTSLLPAVLAPSDPDPGARPDRPTTGGRRRHPRNQPAERANQ